MWFTLGRREPSEMQRFTFAVSIISTTIFWFLTAVPVHAQVVIVEFEGEIDSVPDPIGLLPLSIQIGSPIDGSYEFDVGLGASPVACPTCFGTLYFPNGPSDLTATVEDVTYSDPVIAVEIADDRLVPGDGLRDFWAANNSPGFAGPVFVIIRFGDTTLTRLDSEDFFVNTSLDGWDTPNGNFLLVFWDGSAITELATGTFSFVPEPSASLMLASGIGALMMLSKVRR